MKRRYLDIIRETEKHKKIKILEQPMHIQRALMWGMGTKALTGRYWFLVGNADGYESESNRVMVFALNGSPIRGIVIATSQWACRYDGFGTRKSNYSVYDDDTKNFEKKVKGYDELIELENE